MGKRPEEYFCDVCQLDLVGAPKTVKLQVIFETEQTEGRYCKPYLSDQSLDICTGCMDTIITEGRYLHAHGAMGYNTFYFKGNK